MKRPLRLLLAAAAVWQLAAATGLSGAESAPPVTVREDAESATLDNGIVFAQVKKSNGNLLSLRFHGLELLSKGGGYWNLYGAIPGQPSTQEKGAPAAFRVSQDPAANGGAMGEITLRFPYLGQAKTVPMDIEIRYTLRRGDTGLYGWTIADHQPQYPAFNVEVSTVCLKLNPDIFDFLSIDEKRQRHMATAEDWVKGTQLNLWEARRLNTGIRQGEVEHKYDYSFVFAQTPAWGWSSLQKHVGVFVVNPSTEYLNGAATEVDYGGHIDVKAKLPADPTLLFIWHSPHYGGRGIEIKAGEPWHKVVGPFLIYCGAGDTPEIMWRNALARAAQDQQHWPYAWADGPGYEHADGRGGATGRLTIEDPQAPGTSVAGAWVGLAQPPYTASFKKSGPTTIDWQTDGKHYEYWGRVDREGHFTIRNARPGDYTLYAFTDGVLGDFSRANVHVDAGQTTDLGSLTWVPVRQGKQLWEIGIPNRSAEEFRHGDHYWQWGLYNLYAQEFPHDVDYVVGKSDWRKDWNYVQPPHLEGKNGTDSTWKIRFEVAAAEAGTATLRLAICGARGGPVDVLLNGKSVGTTGPLPESGVMHRDGIRSAALVYCDIAFDASLLKPGENVIALTKRAKAWTDGVLYDYVRLELAN